MRELHEKMRQNGWDGTEMTLRNLESGRVRFPQESTLRPLAAAFGKPEQFFFTGKDTAAMHAPPAEAGAGAAGRSRRAGASGRGRR